MRLTAKILLTVYLIGLSGPFMVMVNYYSNLDFIREVLCINKEEAITVCNGTCYLKVQLKDFYQEQHHTGERPSSNEQKVGWEINLYAIPDNYLSLQSVSQVKASVLYFIKDYHHPDSKIFHPPQLV
ncbi:hypothetical protein QQ020_05755 [Fulvivirgaceae bacterium BMA12]|uniref:Uncharacterized protein n=1 Tax=Agaribacillus aureus TaxID=3051825 RepID=A0ABT8L1D8_9BACT|nr:hypothetical protein [Fulvivirgaceae bacterium BMA12]